MENLFSIPYYIRVKVSSQSLPPETKNSSNRTATKFEASKGMAQMDQRPKIHRSACSVNYAVYFILGSTLLYTNYDTVQRAVSSRRSWDPSRGAITATFRANFEGYTPSLPCTAIHRLIALMRRDRRSFVSCGTIPRGTRLEEISFSFSFARLSRADFSRARCPLREGKRGGDEAMNSSS